jgi:hypothetical protein
MYSRSTSASGSGPGWPDAPPLPGVRLLAARHLLQLAGDHLLARRKQRAVLAIRLQDRLEHPVDLVEQRAGLLAAVVVQLAVGLVPIPAVRRQVHVELRQLADQRLPLAQDVQQAFWPIARDQRPLLLRQLTQARVQVALLPEKVDQLFRVSRWLRFGHNGSPRLHGGRRATGA